uniref:Uncharacterized protein n=1 Tax=Anguilla anguilla TaxID=7936 RepID=A0A0E9RM42_ANGAN
MCDSQRTNPTKLFIILNSRSQRRTVLYFLSLISVFEEI